MQDLPPGFVEMPPAELGLAAEDLSQEGFVVDDLFVFLDSEHFELILGFTVLIPGRLEQVAFDLILQQPDFIVESFIGGMGTEMLEQEALPGLDDIGDASTGLTVVAEAEGIPMRIDGVLFRRGSVGVFLFVLYLDGDVPVVSVDELARKLDSRIVEALPRGH